MDIRGIARKLDVFHIVRGSRDVVAKWIWSERRHHSFSRLNPDKQFYVIRRQDSRVGIFSNFAAFLGHLSYTDKNNMIPVIDMKNYPNIYLDLDQIKQVNAWEYYFRQPTKYSLEEALKSKNVILGQGAPPTNFIKPEKNLFLNVKGELDYWRNLCKKYIHLADGVQKRLEDERTKLIAGKGKILGVSCRGTDYITLKPKDHPIQPSAEMLMEQIDVAVKECGFQYIYLATEDKRIMEKMKKQYGDKLILMKRNYVEYDYHKSKKGLGANQVTIYSTKRKNDKYLQGMEYIVSMLLLTKCDGLITSMTSGSTGIMCMTEKPYEYLYVFDLGVY